MATKGPLRFWEQSEELAGANWKRLTYVCGIATASGWCAAESRPDFCDCLESNRNRAGESEYKLVANLVHLLETVEFPTIDSNPDVRHTYSVPEWTRATDDPCHLINALVSWQTNMLPNGLEMSRPASSRILLDEPNPQLAGSAPSSC